MPVVTGSCHSPAAEPARRRLGARSPEVRRHDGVVPCPFRCEMISAPCRGFCDAKAKTQHLNHSACLATLSPPAWPWPRLSLDQGKTPSTSVHSSSTGNKLRCHCASGTGHWQSVPSGEFRLIQFSFVGPVPSSFVQNSES